jgi:hypothetical protein
MASNEKEEGDIRGCRATGGCLFKDTRGWIRGQITGLKSFVSQVLFGTYLAYMIMRTMNKQEDKMIKKRFIIILAFALMLLLPQSLRSQSDYEYIHSPGTDIYFGYITYTEVKHDGNDPVVIREGEESPQVAELNFPLLPGDTIRTTGSRRCEIQLDTGTIIRLDLNTELKIETIMAKSLSSRNKVTNFLLNRGEMYIMYKKYNYPEIFQVITPTASTKLSHSTVALIGVMEDGSTDIQVKRGKALVLYGPSEESLEEETVLKSMSLRISGDHQAFPGEYEQNADFELWNLSINKNFSELHDGMSAIPKPIQRYPRAVVYFAQKYSSMYGEWIWDDLYGYVWRTDFNDYYPGGTWQPYYFGQWREVNGQLFWVPVESWGWVPYHLGLWVWNKNRGWLWIPGSSFSPAWVSWSFFGEYCSWRPWSFSDWYLTGTRRISPNFFLFHPGFPWSLYGTTWDDSLLGELGEDGISRLGEDGISRMISRNQLKKTASSTYPLPKAFKGTLKKVVSALESGDERVLASLRRISEHTVAVKNGDLSKTRIHERTIAPHELSIELKKKPLSSETLNNPLSEAARIYRKDENFDVSEKTVSKDSAEPKNTGGGLEAITIISLTRTKKDAKSEKAGKRISDLLEDRTNNTVVVPSGVPLDRPPQQRPPRLKQTIAHTRDWNPDAGVARRAGISLNYSSKTNEIKCPELNLSSRTVRRSQNMATMTELSSSRRGGYYTGPRISSSPGSESSSSTRAVSSNRSSSSSLKNKEESSKKEGSSSGKTIKK